jgi:hypothetical protein
VILFLDTPVDETLHLFYKKCTFNLVTAFLPFLLSIVPDTCTVSPGFTKFLSAVILIFTVPSDLQQQQQPLYGFVICSRDVDPKGILGGSITFNNFVND